MTGLEFAGQLSMGLVLGGAAAGSALGIGAAAQAPRCRVRGPRKPRPASR